MNRVRRETLADMVKMFEEAQNISCGCPESRLCNHEREIEAYQTAAGMIEDVINDEERKK